MSKLKRTFSAFSDDDTKESSALRQATPKKPPLKRAKCMEREDLLSFVLHKIKEHLPPLSLPAVHPHAVLPAFPVCKVCHYAVGFLWGNSQMCHLCVAEYHDRLICEAARELYADDLPACCRNGTH